MKSKPSSSGASRSRGGTYPSADANDRTAPQSARKKPRAWVFKINTRRGWEFDQYFHSRSRKPFPIGNDGWIRSARSLRCLREEVKRGDIFLCYEVDRKLLVGIARAESDGRDCDSGPLLDLSPPGKAVRLESPLKRHPDLDHILAFTPQRGRGTVQKIDRDEFARLRRILLNRNPEQQRSLKKILG